MVVKKEEGLIEYRFQPVESKFEVDEYRASSIVEKHALLRVEGYQLDRECWRWKLDKVRLYTSTTPRCGRFFLITIYLEARGNSCV